MNAVKSFKFNLTSEKTSKNACSYYPFGMTMPGRSYSLSSEYRFGFNTQEKDDEVYGEGNSYTAQFWQYDSRIGRRWNLDPIDQISVSNYAVNYNNPIWVNDVLGNTGKKTGSKKGKMKGKLKKVVITGKRKPKKEENDKKKEPTDEKGIWASLEEYFTDKSPPSKGSDAKVREGSLLESRIATSTEVQDFFRQLIGAFTSPLSEGINFGTIIPKYNPFGKDYDENELDDLNVITSPLDKSTSQQQPALKLETDKDVKQKVEQSNREVMKKEIKRSDTVCMGCGDVINGKHVNNEHNKEKHGNDEKYKYSSPWVSY